MFNYCIKKLHLLISSLVILFLLFSTQIVQARQTQSKIIKIGVLAYKGKVSAMKKWGAHADYLNTRLAPLHFKIIPLSYKNDELANAVINKEINFVITNPGQYTELKIKGYLSHIATRRTQRMSGSHAILDNFGGTVITQKNRLKLNNYKDLKGLHILIPSQSSLGGWQVHLREALKQGIDLRTEAKITELKDHRKVVYAIKQGIADAGFIRSDLLEEMQANGKINKNDFKIINEQKNPNYPYKLSTRLYPEWPIAVVTGTDKSLATEILHTLLEMPPNSKAAIQANIYGWSIAGQYNKIDELFRETHLGPYTNKKINFKNVIDKYKFQLLSFLSLICLLLIYSSCRVFRTNQKLLAENKLRLNAESNLLILNKELQCLYKLSCMSDKHNKIEEYLQAIVDILPKACDYPEKVGIKISYQQKDFQTENYHADFCSINQAIIIDGKQRGNLELSYLKNCQESIEPQKNSREYNFIQTAGKQIENTLQQLQVRDHLKLAASVFEHTSDGIIITDSQLQIMDVNSAFCYLTGYSRNEIIGKTPSLFHSGRHDKNFYISMWQVINKKGTWKGKIWNKKKNGELYMEMLNIYTILQGDGSVSKYIGVSSDITQEIIQHEQLTFMAHHDILTKLPNRTLFRDRLRTSLALSRRSENLLAIAYLDLDDFKPVNDTYGHEIGDKLLIEVANRMLLCVREGDSVARLGGDEFALLLSNIINVDECYAILNRILEHISESYFIADHKISVSASIGVTLSPIDGVNSDTLLRHADQAMYMAKASGRNQFHLFNYKLDHFSQTKH